MISHFHARLTTILPFVLLASPGALAATPAQPPPPTTAAAQDPLTGIHYTKVSVDFDNLTPRDATAAFSQQTGYKVQWNEPRGADPGLPLSLHLKNVPLLEAWFQLVAATDATPAEFWRDLSMLHNIRIGQRPSTWFVNGPFGTALNNPNFPFTPDPTPPTRKTPLAHFSLDFYIEPSLDGIIFPSTVTLDSCVDEHNHPILIDAERPTHPDLHRAENVPYSQHLIDSLQVNVTLPDSPGRTVPLLKGTALFAQVTQTRQFATAAPDEHLQKDLQGATVDIAPFKSIAPPFSQPGANIPDNHALVITFQRNQMPQETWNAQLENFRQCKITIFNNWKQPVRFLCPDRPLHDNPWSADSVELHCLIKSNPANPALNIPHDVLIEIPTQSRTFPVPFQFKNLPLTAEKLPSTQTAPK